MLDKVAIITGATSGIGRASAVKFARKDYRVVAVGRNQTELDLLRDEISSGCGVVKTEIADLSDVLHIEKLVANVIDEFGRIDVLVNSAGIIAMGSVLDTTLENWDDMMNINLRSVFYISNKCVPYLEET